MRSFIITYLSFSLTHFLSLSRLAGGDLLDISFGLFEHPEYAKLGFDEKDLSSSWSFWDPSSPCI